MGIFSEDGIKLRLSQQIKHLNVNPYESLSTQMCMDCIFDLRMSYKFFMQIKKAEVKLKSIHVNLTTDNATKKVTIIDESLTTKEEKQSSCTGIILCIFHVFFYCISIYVINNYTLSFSTITLIKRNLSCDF